VRNSKEKKLFFTVFQPIRSHIANVYDLILSPIT
jgi:hypothetical protein